MIHASFNIQRIYKSEDVAVIDAAYRKAVKVIGGSGD